MTSLLFDTHKAVKDLQEAGFDEAQAEAVVSTLGTAIVGNVATKQDVNDIRSEIQDIRANAATKQDVSDLRSEIQTPSSDLCSELRAMELRLTLHLGSMIVAGFALIALVKLL